MQKALSYLQNPRVHAALSALSLLAGIFWPQYKPILDQLALMGTYGATMTGAAEITGVKK